MLPTRISRLIDRKAIKGAYQRLFSTPDGKVVLRHLMRECFVNKPTFVSGDQQQSNLNEGSRRAVLSIMNQVFRDDTELNQQIEEGMQE